jgi:hypothetical protein
MIDGWARSDLAEAQLRVFLRLDADQRANCRDWTRSLPRAFKEIRQAYQFARQHDNRVGDGPEVNDERGVKTIAALEAFTLAAIKDALWLDKKALRQRPSDYELPDPTAKQKTRPDEHDYPRLWRHVRALEAAGMTAYAATRRAADIIAAAKYPQVDKTEIARLHGELYKRYRAR